MQLCACISYASRCGSHKLARDKHITRDTIDKLVDDAVVAANRSVQELFVSIKFISYILRVKKYKAPIPYRHFCGVKETTLSHVQITISQVPDLIWGRWHVIAALGRARLNVTLLSPSGMAVRLLIPLLRNTVQFTLQICYYSLVLVNLVFLLLHDVVGLFVELLILANIVLLCIRLLVRLRHLLVRILDLVVHFFNFHSIIAQFHLVLIVYYLQLLVLPNYFLYLRPVLAPQLLLYL